MKINNLKIITGNVAGILTKSFKCKVQMFADRAKVENVALMTFVESHLNSSFLDGEIHIDNYTILRSDRMEPRRKGGIVMYVREDIAAGTEVLWAHSDSFCEVLMANVKVLQLVVVVIYRPPLCPGESFSNFLRGVSQRLNELTPMPTLIVTGDFNLPVINWGTEEISANRTEDRIQAEYFLEFSRSFCLEQKVVEPTRGNNILDLFLTNCENLVRSYTVEDTIISDHRLLTFETNLLAGYLKSKCTPILPLIGYEALCFDSSEVQWDQIRMELLKVKWTSM